MKELVDVTGKHPLVPACPRCDRKVALIMDMRPASTRAEGKSTGFWRCPHCHHVFVQKQAGSPTHYA